MTGQAEVAPVPGPNDPIEEHYPRFSFTRQMLANAAATCSTKWIVDELRDAVEILGRPEWAG